MHRASVAVTGAWNVDVNPGGDDFDDGGVVGGSTVGCGGGVHGGVLRSGVDRVGPKPCRTVLRGEAANDYRYPDAKVDISRMRMFFVCN